MNEKLKSIVNQIITLLIASDFQKVVELTNGTRMTSEEIQRALHEYGRTLIAPPSKGFDLMDAVEVEGMSIPQYSIRMPLWTQEEGMSDLTLELTVKISNEKTEVELDDIHVL